MGEHDARNQWALGKAPRLHWHRGVAFPLSKAGRLQKAGTWSQTLPHGEGSAQAGQANGWEIRRPESEFRVRTVLEPQGGPREQGRIQ